MDADPCLQSVFQDDVAVNRRGVERTPELAVCDYSSPDALKNAGCRKIFTDTVSGAVQTREGLERAMDALREGDTLVVWKLDRLGRSLPHLVVLINALRDKGIGFRSLQENIDTTSGVGKLVFHIFACRCVGPPGRQLSAHVAHHKQRAHSQRL